MSLPNKISEVTFSIRNSSDVEQSSHTITVSNLRHPWEMNFWDSRQQLSIGGVRRKKNIIRGFDSRLEFDWEDVRNQETEIVALIDDLKVATDNDYDIRFNVVGDTNYLFLVPDEAVYAQNYKNQVTRRSTTRITFLLAELSDDISYA